MSEQTNTEMVTIVLNGKEVAVPKGTNLVDAAAMHGVEIPHYCYHPKLSVSGNCRMCMVEMGMPGRDRETKEPILDESGQPVIQWMPKPVIGCSTNAAEGMQVRTDSPMVKECQEGVMEFLLINHPLDCPICDQAGECTLQEFAADYGRGYSRFVENKNVKPKRTRIGPRVMLDDERCILCSRCIRFCKEIAEDDVLGFVDRGSYSTLTVFPGKELANNYSLNTVDICPVGALTSLDFRFKMRVWFLKETESIDTETSVGCNTVVGSREGRIYRITPRRNDEVNDTWMPDSGRILYRAVEAEDRMTGYSIEGKPCSPDEALTLAGTVLKSGGVAVVGSGRLSVEEQFLLKAIAEQCDGNEHIPVYLVARYGEGDGKLVSADRNPNLRGALLTGLIADLPGERLDGLAQKIAEGTVRTLLVVGEDLTKAGIAVEALKKLSVVYVGSHHNGTSQHAKVEIPIPTVFEKAGTLVNQQFRVQRFRQAVPPPQGVLPGYASLVRLWKAIAANPEELNLPAPNAEGVWELMSQRIPEFEGMSFEGLPSSGKVVDGGRFAQLEFVEGPSLHFEPKSVLAEASV